MTVWTATTLSTMLGLLFVAAVVSNYPALVYVTLGGLALLAAEHLPVDED